MSAKKKTAVDHLGGSRKPGKTEKEPSVLEILGLPKESAAAARPSPRLNELGLRKFPYPSRLFVKVRAGSVLGNSGAPKTGHDEIYPEDFSDSEIKQLKVVTKLLNDPGFDPPDNIRKSPAWWILPEILAGMPFEFRKLAMAKFEEGTRVFGKVPVREDAQPSPTSTSPSANISIVGQARPMGCPEPPPEGCKFILAWREGEFWNWNLGEFEFDWKQVDAGHFQPRLLAECDKYLQCLRNQAEQGDSIAASVAQGILAIMAQQSKRLQTTSPSDLEIGLYAGVLLTRLVIYRDADQLYAERTQPKKSAWPDIIRYALDRHGWQISAEDLIAAMHGRVISTSEVKAAHPVEFSDWGHLPHEDKPLIFSEFSKKITAAKSEQKKTDPTRAYLAKVKGMLSKVPGKQERLRKDRDKSKEEKIKIAERKRVEEASKKK